MIRSFADRGTREFFEGYPVRRFHSVERPALKKLRILDAAMTLMDLRLPSLHLEKLVGDRKGQHSIRINDKYRICFEWREDGVYQVEIVDYH
jgi:proteic killer suppression protein